MWTKGEAGAMPQFATAEIETADLAGLALDLANWGTDSAAEMAFLTPPPAGAWAEARDLLTSLGALDGESGRMSELKSLWHNATQGATFMHDFCVTARRVVLFEGSMNIRPTRMLGGNHPLRYDDSQTARFGLADLDPATGAVTAPITIKIRQQEPAGEHSLTVAGDVRAPDR